MMTRPISAPTVAAAANGPGVGGTKTCVVNKPVDRAIANTVSDMPVRLLKALFRVDRITNPESQNTGMETINPVMLIARGALLSPTMPNTEEPIDRAPPLFSKNVPMIVPHAITMPILLSVFPNPSVSLASTSVVPRPPRKPMKMAASKSVRKGCSLNFVVPRMMKPMMSTRKMSVIMLFTPSTDYSCKGSVPFS